MGVIMPAARVTPASHTETLAHTSTSVRQARSRLSAMLYDRGVLPPVIDDAVLILSEFVTNALRHARALGSGGIRVSWELNADGLLRIEVTDGGGTTRPSTKPYSMSVSAQAGRGLEIVDQLADRWGSQREEGGDEYTVWAELVVRARHAAARRGRERGGSAPAANAGTVTPLSRPGVAASAGPVSGGAASAGGSSAGSDPIRPAPPPAAIIHLLPPYPGT
jgi:anti-sigma regulatory factor (Ser/Thr protein kinase)